MLYEFLTFEDRKINLLSAAVMQVKADKSEVIAPVLSPVIILPSSWSHWLFLETLNKWWLSWGCSHRPQCSGAAPAPQHCGPEEFVGISTAGCRALNWDKDADHNLAALAGLVLE